MNINFTAIQDGMDSANVPMEKRTSLVAAGFARVLAYRLPIPCGALDNPAEYFDREFRARVVDELAALNEGVVIDIDLAADLVRQLWLFRYSVVYDANNQAVRRLFDQVASCGPRELRAATSALVAECVEVPGFESLFTLVGRAVSKPE